MAVASGKGGVGKSSATGRHEGLRSLQCLRSPEHGAEKWLVGAWGEKGSEWQLGQNALL